MEPLGICWAGQASAFRWGWVKTTCRWDWRSSRRRTRSLRSCRLRRRFNVRPIITPCGRKPEPHRRKEGATLAAPSGSRFSLCSAVLRARRLGQAAHLRRLRTLGTFFRFVLHGLAILKCLETLPFDDGMMHENVSTPFVRGDESETLLIVEPLHLTSGHDEPLLSQT